jgi:RimJ/RimL family protein N-acetyltransferase
MILRSSTNDDLSVLMSWIKDKDACRIWAGPCVRFPLAPEHLKEDIHFSEENTFSMINERAALLGLGQLIQKDNRRLHMARIIVSPNHRGKGLGSLLCRLLIREGKKRAGEIHFSLNVYPDNTKAVRLYKKLGFKTGPQSPGSNAEEKSMHMILKADRAIEANPPSPGLPSSLKFRRTGRRGRPPSAV